MKALLIFFTCLGLFPVYISACSVCFVGKEGTMEAYYGTAIVLSLLPLLMVGGLAFWVFRRYKQNSDLSEDNLPPNRPMHPHHTPSG